ncbi:hypothetical protein OCOJLMKI_1181 [Methylobacterium iners]|uniref:Response regulatory domain-containing protein n=1 Tax=Methylobacterium iners TaxID=418707 RepID=A0ABQ4RT85_9HYPH|nr:hypothetical protein OCOJLMKI_1181 [Methylobacterium iners]
MIKASNKALNSESALIVEIEALIALNLINLLKDIKHHVHGPAAKSVQAKAFASATQPDLAFIDMNLPGA